MFDVEKNIQEQSILNYYKDHTQVETMQHFGITRGKLIYIIQKNGAGKERRHYDKAGICAAWDAGESAVSIAKRFCVSPMTVYRCNKGKPLRNRKLTTGDLQKIRALREDGFTASEIAAVTGINTGTVHNHIKGVPKGRMRK